MESTKSFGCSAGKENEAVQRLKEELKVFLNYFLGIKRMQKPVYESTGITESA